jgi:two-component sensor histidine kinase
MNQSYTDIFAKNAPVAIIGTNADFEILYANEKAASLGFLVSDHLIVSLSNKFYSKANYENLIRQETPFYIEAIADSESHFQVSCAFSKEENVWTIAISQSQGKNINDTSNYDSFVKKSVDKLPIDIVIYDKDLHFVYINEVAVKDEFLRKWLIGKTILDYVEYRNMSKEHGISRMSFFNAILENKEEVDWIDEYQYKEGGTKYMLRNYFPFIQNEEVIFLYGCGFDITKQKEIEYNLEKSINDLKVQNKQLNQFSYITSHNLRSHSSNLLALTELIDFVKENSTELDEVLNKIKIVTKNLDSTLYDLNSILNIKTLADNPDSVNLKDLCNDIITLLEDQLNELDATLLLDLKVENIFATRSYINGVLQNLFTNSIKYSSTGRPPKIIVSSYLDAEGQVIIKVGDNGIGIDLAKDSEKLFQLYKRLHPLHASGKGIGLFLVKSLVQSMHGTIEVESEVNVGTTFTITLPKKAIVVENDLTTSTRVY